MTPADDPAAGSPRSTINAPVLGPIPWWGRLEVRVVAALLLLGTLCVSASAYLVQMTVVYFDARLGVALGDADEVARSVEPIHRDLVGAHIALFKARARTLSLELAVQSAAGADGAILTALVADNPDVLALEFERNDGTSVERDRRPQFPRDRFDEYVVDVDVAIPGTPPIGDLRASFWIDPTIDERFQELGQRKREIGLELQSQADIDDAVRQVVGAASVLVLVFAISLGFVLVRTTTKKAGAITSVMNRVGRGEVAARAGPLGRDELGRLAEAFDRMLDELQSAQERVGYLQRIGAWQEMARRIAHEIKNPLTPIQLAVQQLREKDPGTHREFSTLLATSVEIVEDEIATLRRMVASFSQFAKVPAVHLEPVSIGRVLDEFARAYGHLTDDSEDELIVTPATPDVEILGDRQLLKQVLVNLVENAVLSAREAGCHPVRVEVSAVRHGGRVVVRVDDNGPGIADDRKRAVFEPYETSRAEGTGLGLAIVKKIVFDHAGEIHVADAPLGGARFELHLPIASEPS